MHYLLRQTFKEGLLEELIDIICISFLFLTQLCSFLSKYTIFVKWTINFAAIKEPPLQLATNIQRLFAKTEKIRWKPVTWFGPSSL